MAPDELGKLVDGHAAALVLYARQWCASADDVVQDAFVKLFEQTAPVQKPVAWLYRVVRNGAISAARADDRRKAHRALMSRCTAVWFVPDRDAEIDPEEAESALQALPLDEREVIVAHLWGGLTFAEIGDNAGYSSSTAHRLYASGLSRLRERLGVICPKNRVNPI